MREDDQQFWDSLTPEEQKEITEAYKQIKDRYRPSWERWVHLCGLAKIIATDKRTKKVAKDLARIGGRSKKRDKK